jgi:RNA polymerase sigma factor (TIGR02999 family)
MPNPPHQDVTVLLERAGRGDSRAAGALLPLVYEELRQLAAARMAKEPGRGLGQTLQPTALVHEAYIRLLGRTQGGSEIQWDSRGHFFGAAAAAMRRILIERARARGCIKRGGDADGRAPRRADIDLEQLADEPEGDDLLGLDEAMKELEQIDKRKHEVVMLRYFAGLSIEDTALALNVSAATVKNDWTFARAWLRRAVSRRAGLPLRGSGQDPPPAPALAPSTEPAP